MITKKLLKSSNLRSQNGFRFKVEYFITESRGILNDNDCRYGIYIKNNPCLCPGDIYSAPGCFESEANARILLYKLDEHNVTPVCAGESIDAVIESCDFKY